ncbi:Protein of unknown function DUF4390 [Gemmatirosa kalamazoonensis]|uniref:DUF4390 domain-containing protein n=1 Tax=Gemmatirosa kalamazoonensis TaxID=861299 RepID=W0RI82_9BACT|nr:DUF4390 domain-containing protein [Gemmatirosa kalamazoonensis]AHG90132.1 Protein of unknown function DUF4390 [Gemmatirosa kalamazoonensis]
MSAASFRRRFLVPLASVVAFSTAPGVVRPLSAQGGRPGIEIRLPDPASRATEGPLVLMSGVLAEREMRDLLEHGFPLRVHFRVELWTVAGWFDDLRGTQEWDVVLQYDPLRKSYGVARVVDNRVTPLGVFDSYEDASQAAERPYRVPLTARRGRRSYYSAVVDVETISLNDLDEVQRWLRGELRPAVRGERNPGTALGRGLRTLATRLLGSESRHYETRSGTFRP